MAANTENSNPHDALAERCKKGDNDAFRELYLLYSKAMFSICIRLLNNKEEAEDVLQDCFIAAFKNIKQYEGKASFGSWLKRIVINKCLDSIKKRQLNISPIDDYELPDDNVQEELPEYDIETIKQGILSLPDGFRVILTLYLFEDYTHKMIAEKLGISEGTSKSQYSRARKKLTGLITQKQQP